MKKLRKKSLFCLIGFIVFFHLLEVGYRVFEYYRYATPILGIFSKASMAESTIGRGSRMVVGHPLMHYVLNPDRWESHTADYFRITDDVESPTEYIVCMGGSSTYGLSVLAQEAYPNQLQLNLSAQGHCWKVFNAGVPGWRMPHHISRYVHDLRYREPRPDLIILYSGFNETWLSLLNNQSLPGYGESLRLFPDEVPRWTAYRFLLWFFERVEALWGANLIDNHLNDFAYHPITLADHINPKNFARFRQEFELFLQIVTTDNVPLLIVLQNTNGMFDSVALETAFYLVRETMRGIAVEHAIRIVDMQEITPSQPEYFTDVIHMSPLGNQTRAKHLAPIVEHLLTSP